MISTLLNHKIKLSHIIYYFILAVSISSLLYPFNKTFLDIKLLLLFLLIFVFIFSFSKITKRISIELSILLFYLLYGILVAFFIKKVNIR